LMCLETLLVFIMCFMRFKRRPIFGLACYIKASKMVIGVVTVDKLNPL